MNPENLPRNEPWITKEGFFDSTKFPIDNVLKHALSDDDRVFRSGLRTLRLMYPSGADRGRGLPPGPSGQLRRQLGETHRDR